MSHEVKGMDQLKEIGNILYGEDAEEGKGPIALN
jgi:hypothetical protein